MKKNYSKRKQKRTQKKYINKHKKSSATCNLKKYYFFNGSKHHWKYNKIYNDATNQQTSQKKSMKSSEYTGVCDGLIIYNNKNDAAKSRTHMTSN